jgi:phosphomethylpyrimidine synthase
MREVILQPSRRADGASEENPRICLYDTSGPWTDPDARLDVHEGLPPVRARWIEARGDVERYPGRDGHYARDGEPVPFPGLACAPAPMPASPRCTTRGAAS